MLLRWAIRARFGSRLSPLPEAGVVDVIWALAGQENGSNSSTFLKPLLRVCLERGVEVGTRRQIEEMSRAIVAEDIRPVLDSQRFRLEELKGAYTHVWSRKRFGKVVITIDGK